MAHTSGRSPFGGAQSSSSSLVFEEFVPPSAWTEDSTCHYLLVDLPGFKKQELKLQVDNGTHVLISGERQERENKYKRFEQSFELPKDADIQKITGKLDAEILYVSVPKKVGQERKDLSEPAPVSDEDDNDDQKSDAYESDDEQEHKEIKHGSIPAPSPAPRPASEDDDEDDNDKKSDAYESEEREESDDIFGEKVLERKKHRTGFDDNWGQDADLFLRLAMEKLKKNKRIVATAIFAFSLGMLVGQKFQSNGH
ncbi:hypothetical protein SSX86_025563 [Deinandra increscens subsp. villosa]|uniref:SHSP domain-containing protein n=1 Tax=Deinandra increscens subsp. villosa TaxID=3103831 RepID=A0AAP0CI66_9ASTR